MSGDVHVQFCERLGVRFPRATHRNIYVQSLRAGERVMASVTDFLARRLKLTVNAAKSAVDRPSARAFLGFSFTAGPTPQRVVSPKALARFKARVRELTRRTKRVRFTRLVEELSRYLVGWRGYFGFCEVPYQPVVKVGIQGSTRPVACSTLAGMAMGTTRDDGSQQSMWVATTDLPRNAGHPFYERLNRILSAAGFDAFVEGLCARFYTTMGRPSLAPGRYFRLLLLGYFEGLDSERAIAWRAADSLSLRAFLNLAPPAAPPDHSTISRTRRLFPVETHQAVFT